MAFYARYVDTQSMIIQSKSKIEKSASDLVTAQAENATLIESEQHARTDGEIGIKSIESLERQLEKRKEPVALDIELRVNPEERSELIATNSGSKSGVISFLAGIRTADRDYLD